MNLDEIITIIPPKADALDRVTTPFVAFEHPFEDRVGRFERQIESMVRYTPVIVVGDTWPDSFHDPMSWGRFKALFKQYRKPQPRWSACIWPESAIYATGIAKMLGVNEAVRYRPQLWTFCQFFDQCNTNREDDIDILPEGSIYVDDRMIYPLAYPKLKLQPEACELSVIVFGNPKVVSGVSTPGDAEIIIVKEAPSGRVFNEAVEKARGHFIAVCQEADRIAADRFVCQLKDDVDFSLSPVASSSRIPPWSIRGYTQSADVPNNQLSTWMFRRSIFEQLEGAHPDLTAGFDYDLYVRIVSDHRFSVAYHADSFVWRKYELPFGLTYTQQVYNDAVNRIRYTKDYHALSVRARDLGKRILDRSRSAHPACV